jgi:GT2 family glycosyltransferase
MSVEAGEHGRQRVSAPERGEETVAVAIVSWNTCGLLAQALASLRADAERGLADVWVVDNASSDGSPEMVAREFPWVSLVASGENLGFGPAVNLVAARTRSPWLAPANADIRLLDSALSALIRAGETYPRAGVVAPRLLTPTGDTQVSVYPFPTLPFTVAYVTGAARASTRLARRWYIDDGFDPEQAAAVPWAVGAFLLVRREAWDEVGGFDERQWMYAEDLDLGWRMQRAGWHTRYEPTARVMHDESAATKQAWGAERHERWHDSTYAWLRQRRGPTVAKAIAGVNVTGYLGRAAVHTGTRNARARRDALNAARAHAAGLRRSPGR